MAAGAAACWLTVLTVIFRPHADSLMSENASSYKHLTVFISCQLTGGGGVPKNIQAVVHSRTICTCLWLYTSHCVSVLALISGENLFLHVTISLKAVIWWCDPVSWRVSFCKLWGVFGKLCRKLVRGVKGSSRRGGKSLERAVQRLSLMFKQEDLMIDLKHFLLPSMQRPTNWITKTSAGFYFERQQEVKGH